MRRLCCRCILILLFRHIYTLTHTHHRKHCTITLSNFVSFEFINISAFYLQTSLRPLRSQLRLSFSPLSLFSYLSYSKKLIIWGCSTMTPLCSVAEFLSSDMSLNGNGSLLQNYHTVTVRSSITQPAAASLTFSLPHRLLPLLCQLVSFLGSVQRWNSCLYRGRIHFIGFLGGCCTSLQRFAAWQA